ncbi:MAG: hypothetical protein IGBAC_1614 [Ignavibacteriae bacterium]|nr:MAG: hypothetical protein IGBAC_1614 [Ignavibacteriota bacterium]
MDIEFVDIKEPALKFDNPLKWNNTALSPAEFITSPPENAE